MLFPAHLEEILVIDTADEKHQEYHRAHFEEILVVESVVTKQLLEMITQVSLNPDKPVLRCTHMSDGTIICEREPVS